MKINNIAQVDTVEIINMLFDADKLLDRLSEKG